MATKKSFLNAPAARMLTAQSAQEETVAPETQQEDKIEASKPVEVAPTPKKEERANKVEHKAAESEMPREEVMTKVMIEMPIYQAYRMNKIINEMKLKRRGKYTKKMFLAEAIAEAIEKYEKELQ